MAQLLDNVEEHLSGADGQMEANYENRQQQQMMQSAADYQMQLMQLEQQNKRRVIQPQHTSLQMSTASRPMARMAQTAASRKSASIPKDEPKSPMHM